MAYNNFNQNKPRNSQQKHDDNAIKSEPFIPLSSETTEKLSNSNCNFSLYSPRMVSWKFSEKELKLDESVIKSLFEQSVKSFDATSGLLKKKKELQKTYITELNSQGVKTWEIEAKTTSPFITGLGSGHPTETGMILDRNIGVPYITASSIKGVLRLSHAINCADENGNVDENNDCIVKYFGTTGDVKEVKRGQLIILDAYPDSERVLKLKLDIMNPHFGTYYSGVGTKQPVETETPKPIKFLAVKEGITFIFRCAFIPLGNKILSEDDQQKIQNDVDAMFETAFETVGFGGKTAIGYGRFKKVEAGVPNP